MINSFQLFLRCPKPKLVYSNRKLYLNFIRCAKNIPKHKNHRIKDQSVLYYTTAAGVLAVGLSFAAVPLYRIFCQAYSYGGTISANHDESKIVKMTAVTHRPIRISFNADTASSMQWNFKPQQREIFVVPGETALAFYTAKNPSDVAVTGVSTYNVVPFEAGQYFNKIQCFCFEEQQLNPHEQVYNNCL